MLIAVRRIRLTDLVLLERFEAHVPRAPAVAQRHMERFRALLENALSHEPGGFLVADVNGEAVGAIVARVLGAQHMTGAPMGRFESVIVSPAHPGQGIGERLLKEGEAYLRSHGCKIITLTLSADSHHAADLYRNAGYKVASWELERAL